MPVELGSRALTIQESRRRVDSAVDTPAKQGLSSAIRRYQAAQQAEAVKSCAPRSGPQGNVCTRHGVAGGLRYQNEFTGKCDLGYLFGGAWRQAAKNLVGSMEDWVKKNYTRLMQAKARGSSSSE